MAAIAALMDWLIDGAPGLKESDQICERLGIELRAAGIPVDRINVFVVTLHPHVLGRAFRWTPGEPVKISHLTLAFQQSDVYKKSPAAEVMRRNIELRRRLDRGLSADDFAVLHELAAQGFTDYVCLPLVFTSGEVHAISLASMAPSGFSDQHIEQVRQVVRPLARLAEIMALRRTGVNLLDTYVGRKSGERILAGRIFKGDIETLSAVIWFSDLRGFTELSGRLSPREIIDTLNELFDCQVPAIEACGGEVLKFIGDGLLAIFPLSDPATAPDRCAAALSAAERAFAALERRNATAPHRIQFGLALHIGEFAYGNIGGASRLDFTAIGPAVNLTARLEGLTGQLGRPLVVSEEFARHTSIGLEEIGSFTLKGVGRAQRVFAPHRLPEPTGGG